MKIFAGFWRDGAKVKPSERHWSDCKCIFAIQKHDNSLDICLRKYDEWDRVYWLDTTTPEELTPQEAFELLKLVFPMLTSIEKDRQRDYTMKSDRYTEAKINWGDTKEYPPKKKWRVPTDADKGKRCRFCDHVDKDWTEIESAKFICTWRDGFMVEYITGTPASWKYCEVLDE